MRKKVKKEEKINLDSILFKCRDILRTARNSGSFFEKRDMMLTLVFLRFIGEKFEDGVEKLRQDLIAQGLDPDDEEIFAAFLKMLPLLTVHIICPKKLVGLPLSTLLHPDSTLRLIPPFTALLRAVSSSRGALSRVLSPRVISQLTTSKRS